MVKIFLIVIITLVFNGVLFGDGLDNEKQDERGKKNDFWAYKEYKDKITGKKTGELLFGGTLKLRADLVLGRIYHQSGEFIVVSDKTNLLG